MSDWPTDIQAYGAYGVLSTGGEGAPAADAISNGGIIFTAASAWVTANLGIFAPVVVRRTMTVYQLGWINGGTASGNLDVGIYDRNLNLLTSAGSTAQGTISVPQFADVTDVTLTPGLYYMAMSVDNTTATIQRSNSSTTAPLCRASGLGQMAGAFPLPSTATLAGFISTFGCPLIVGSLSSLAI